MVCGFETLLTMRREKAAPDNLGFPFLLFEDERPADHASNLSKLRFYPSYSLSLAVPRDDCEWFEYLQDAWKLFLTSNLEYVAVQYALLHENLINGIDKIMSRLSEMILVNDADQEATSFVSGYYQHWVNRVPIWLRLRDISSDMEDYNDTLNRVPSLLSGELAYTWDAIIDRASEIVRERRKLREKKDVGLGPVKAA
ncbi:MAG: hypothetical protein ACRD2L_03785, partial [Terriglobia bacterium]